MSNSITPAQQNILDTELPRIADQGYSLATELSNAYDALNKLRYEDPPHVDQLAQDDDTTDGLDFGFKLGRLVDTKGVVNE